jgi:hypothetical protein
MTDLAKKNLTRQASKVLHDIVNAYETGIFDDPNSSAMFCSLLACICEGKVQGVVDEYSGQVKWSLTEEYSEELERMKEAVLQSGIVSGKVVKGPWPQT